MSNDSPSSHWGVLTIAGACGLCCIALGAIAGGAAATGGAMASVTAAGGVVTSLGGLLVVGLATALPLFVIGLVLRRRAQRGD
jgi:hypothetical protein